MRALPGVAIGIICGAIVLTRLYKTTRGSVLMVAIWHAVFDLLSASKASDGTIAMIMSIVIMVWAIMVIILYKPANLSGQEKQTL